ncbi:MAG: MarR family transcriptional regulator [Myxococcota bacterium]
MIRVEESLNFHVIRAARLLRRHLATMTEGVEELTPEQWFVLNRLRHRQTSSQVDLGDHTLMDRPNISRIIGHLEGRGWVRKEVDPNDGRKQLVRLSPEGRRIHDRIAKEVPRLRSEILEGIDAEDVEAAWRVLLKMEENLARFL